MTLEETMEKFVSISNSPSRVIFGYRYFKSKFQGYVGLSNMRLEMVQIKDRKVKHTMAVPVLEVRYGKCYVVFCDNNVMNVLTGPRANILLRSRFLKSDEVASPASHCGTQEVTLDSDLSLIERCVMFATTPSYPGLDMRVPQLFRCTKHPDRLKLVTSPELLQTIGLPAGSSIEDIKKAFVENISSIASPTDEGWVVPFQWVYAGGMIVADSSTLGKVKPAILYSRTPEFVENWARAHRWEIQT